MNNEKSKKKELVGCKTEMGSDIKKENCNYTESVKKIAPTKNNFAIKTEIVKNNFDPENKFGSENSLSLSDLNLNLESAKKILFEKKD